MGVLSHSGSRVICFCFPAGPTMAVRNSRASSGVMAGSARPMNSENEGTLFKPSLKYVGLRLVGPSLLDVEELGTGGSG
jgi:hypothetical protein